MLWMRTRIAGVAAGLILLANVGGCVIEPLGIGHGGGDREGEGRDRHDEHRHDFGVNQGGHFGLYQPYAIQGVMPPARPAVFLPVKNVRDSAGLWA